MRWMTRGLVDLRLTANGRAELRKCSGSRKQTKQKKGLFHRRVSGRKQGTHPRTRRQTFLPPVRVRASPVPNIGGAKWRLAARLAQIRQLFAQLWRAQGTPATPAAAAVMSRSQGKKRRILLAAGLVELTAPVRFLLNSG